MFLAEDKKEYGHWWWPKVTDWTNSQVGSSQELDKWILIWSHGSKGGEETTVQRQSKSGRHLRHLSPFFRHVERLFCRASAKPDARGPLVTHQALISVRASCGGTPSRIEVPLLFCETLSFTTAKTCRFMSQSDAHRQASGNAPSSWTTWPSACNVAAMSG